MSGRGFPMTWFTNPVTGREEVCFPTSVVGRALAAGDDAELLRLCVKIERDRAIRPALYEPEHQRAMIQRGAARRGNRVVWGLLALLIAALAGCGPEVPARAQVEVVCLVRGAEVACDELGAELRLLAGERACSECRGGGEWHDAELVVAGDQPVYDAGLEPEVLLLVGHFRACPVDRQGPAEDMHVVEDGAVLKFEVADTFLWRSGCW